MDNKDLLESFRNDLYPLNKHLVEEDLVSSYRDRLSSDKGFLCSEIINLRESYITAVFINNSILRQDETELESVYITRLKDNNFFSYEFKDKYGIEIKHENNNIFVNYTDKKFLPKKLKVK